MHCLLTFVNIYRLPPYRINSPLVRLDAQGINAAGDANWQLQINGAHGHTSIGHVQVANAVGNATGSNQAYVQRMVRNALNNSLNSGNRYDVTGNCQ